MLFVSNFETSTGFSNLITFISHMLVSNMVYNHQARTSSTSLVGYGEYPRGPLFDYLYWAIYLYISAT